MLFERDRYARLRAIERMDPVRDCTRVTQLFTRDFQSVLMAQVPTSLLLTYAAPRMSRILIASGELRDHPEKRITDSMILQTEMLEHGFGPGNGRQALRRMNEMHRRWDIHPDDFVAVNCEEAVMTISLAERFGWRPVTDNERIGMVEFCKLQAKHMGVKGGMQSYESMVAFREKYFDEQLRFEPQNQILAEALFDYLSRLLPKTLRRHTRALLLSVSDRRVVTACGYDMPSGVTRRLVAAGLHALGRRAPRPDRSNQFDVFIRAVYPRGYDLSEVGVIPPSNRASDEL